MKKVFGILILLAFIALIVYTYGNFSKSYATLSENKMIAKESDNFILHVQVNDNEEGVEVLHSIQYTGKGQVEIRHQSPLVSVSLLDHNHDFTGSYVMKAMEEGNIYHPQKAAILSVPHKDECNLYIKARFEVDGEMKIINHVEELQFK
jgi:hypothetical protein